VNCPYCDEEIVSEDDKFCPKCGKPLTLEEMETPQTPFELPQKSTDLLPVAAVLTIISATFIAAVGFIGAYQYTFLLDYYGATYASQLIGFLIFGVFDIAAATFALIGGVFILKRKRFNVSVLSFAVLIASVVVNYVIIMQYDYSFSDIVIFTAISTLILSGLSGFLVYSSKAEFD
jgi:cation transport ATPase